MRKIRLFCVVIFIFIVFSSCGGLRPYGEPYIEDYTAEVKKISFVNNYSEYRSLIHPDNVWVIGNENVLKYMSMDEATKISQYFAYNLAIQFDTNTVYDSTNKVLAEWEIIKAEKPSSGFYTYCTIKAKMTYEKDNIVLWEITADDALKASNINTETFGRVSRTYGTLAEISEATYVCVDDILDYLKSHSRK